MEKGGHYYEFFHNTRSVKPTILHFQVCGLFKAPIAIFSFVCFWFELLSFFLSFFKIFLINLLIRIFVSLVLYIPPCLKWLYTPNKAPTYI